MLHGQRLTSLFIIVVLLNPRQIESGNIRRIRDSDENGDLMAGMARAPIQHRKEIKLKNDVSAAFEHAQHHHLHERQIQEKPVIHHAEEPGQENDEHGLENHHDDVESGSSLEKDGEIHVEALDRRVREDGEEREDVSGNGVRRRVEIRDIHYHIHKSERARETPDDEDSKLELSGEDNHKEKLHVHLKKSLDSKHQLPFDEHEGNNAWEHFDMHLHSHGKTEGVGEFGYITDEDEAELAEDNEDGAVSGEENYDHEHLKTLHLHRGVQHVMKPRDSHVKEKGIQQEIAKGDVDDEYSGEAHVRRHVQHALKSRDFHVKEENEGDESSGEGDGESAYERRDVHLSHKPVIGNKASKKHKANLASKEQGKGNESGEQEGLSGGEEEKIPEENDEDEDLPDENAKKALQKVVKSLAGKQEHSLKDKHGLRHSQNLKVHAEIDLTHKKELNPPKSKDGYKKKGKILHVHKAHKQQEMRNKDAQTGTQKDLKTEDDFYIDKNDEPKEKLHKVEMRDFEDRKESANQGKRQIDKRTEETETVQRFRRGPYRHLLQFGSEEVVPTAGYIPVSFTQCSHPAVPDKIPDDAVMYIRSECRLCHCKMGELVCSLKPQFCDQHRTNRSCSMDKGEVADGERHFDGCNQCLCRNGELLCTRVRCPSANYNYTNYRILANDTLENETKADVLDGRVRGKDPCMECDYDPILPVCGPNWKTYRSMCHALQCGDLRVEDVKQGACENMNPCDEAKCAQHEICLVNKRGPCLASITTDGNIVECPQYQCVNPAKDCSLDLERKVCGEDRKTYKSECDMSTRGIPLAYYGPCKVECVEDDTRMCGVDGVTFASSCHASRLNSHVDYPGECDEVDLKNNILINSSDREGYNRRCKTVEELARCPEIDCSKHVIYEGSCCRACGTAMSIRLDTAAKDMTTLKTAEDQPYHNFMSLGLIHNTLKILLYTFVGINRCQLTTDLVDTNDISVVYAPIKPEDVDACEQTARKTVDYINSLARNDLEPGQAVLAAAVVMETSEMTFVPRNESVTSVIAKRRKKRATHHEHEPFDNQSERVFPQTIFLLFLVVLGLYWSTNLAEY